MVKHTEKEKKKQNNVFAVIGSREKYSVFGSMR